MFSLTVSLHFRSFVLLDETDSSNSSVCSHLDPLDLIHLSRVSKSFFRLVDGSSFKSVWIGVRKKIKLQDLEAEGMSELQYAAIVFDQYCQVRSSLSSFK